MFFLRLGYFLLYVSVEIPPGKGAEDNMSFFSEQNLIASGRRSCKYLLLFLWFIGFACGVSTAACTDNLASLMRACCDAGVSIVGLFFIPFFPFLISAVAVYYSIPQIVYLTSTVKAFLLGFCACTVFGCFNSGSLLICLLLLFTDLLTGPALYLFQRRCLHDGCRVDIRCCVLTLLWFLIVCAADYLWIVPLLRDII